MNERNIIFIIISQNIWRYISIIIDKLISFTSDYSLCLEWNAIGLIESAFSTFCEGLAGNSSLQTLDLRSNQISHNGAEALASALKRNATLRCLGERKRYFCQQFLKKVG